MSILFFSFCEFLFLIRENRLEFRGEGVNTVSGIMGKRLKQLREKSGLQQKFVADKIGVKNNTLSGYESGNREPDSQTLTKLADFYEVTTDYLHGRTDDPKGFTTEDITRESTNESLYFFDQENLTPEEVEALKEHLEFLRFKAAKENKKDK